MSDLKVCRICLRAQCKVYKYDRFQLKSYYEEVMAQKMSEADGLPLYFCYECATVLHKFHLFKEKCWMGQKLLKQIQATHKEITYERIHEIDREVQNLKSSLDILIVSNRVKNYVTAQEIEDIPMIHEHIKSEEEKEDINRDIEQEQIFSDEASYDDYVNSEIPKATSSDVAVDVKCFDLHNIVGTENNTGEIDPKTEIDNEIKPLFSPQTIFVDVKKDAIVLKNEPIKKKRGKSLPEFGLKKSNPRFATLKLNQLDKNNWNIYRLSEEEAVKEFQQRAESQTYKNAKYKCIDCFKAFSKEEMLKRHNQLRHSEKLGKLECRFCHKRFKWGCKVKRHIVEHFTRYKCLQCGIKVCTENSALLHTEWHKGALKKCPHCGEEFRHRSTFYTHLRTHRSKYLCSLCGMSFVSPSGLHMHRTIKHVEDVMNDDDDDDSPGNTYCEKCDVRFETRKAFEEHRFHSAMHVDGNEEEPGSCGLPRKALGKRSKAKIMKNLMRNSTDEELPAKPKVGRKPRHRRCHRKPTTCNQCGKHFETQAACMKHHLAEHPRTTFFSERHICEICGASLAPGSVAMHQNIHTRQKEYTCDTCGRKFHSAVGLKRHLLTHTGEKPFGCTLCDKRFTQSNSMKLHYKTFHLKEPYPKRNRRKKLEEPSDLPPTEDKSTSESETSQPENEPALPSDICQENNETIHYLTLG